MRFLKLILFVSFCFVVTDAYNQERTFYALLIADTEFSGDIKEGCQKDLVDMQDFYNSIKTSLEGEVVFKKYEIKGTSCNIESLLLQIKSLTSQLKPQDILFIYYTGHGENDNRNPNNPFPDIKLRDRTFSLSGLHNNFKQKVNFCISVADCCNQEKQKTNSFDRVAYKSIGVQEDNKVSEEHFRSLFLKPKGDIIVTSSKKGQFSFATPKGSFFTLNFLETLKKETNYANQVHWNSLLKEIETKMKNSQNTIPGPQMPHYQINIQGQDPPPNPPSPNGKGVIQQWLNDILLASSVAEQKQLKNKIINHIDPDNPKFKVYGNPNQIGYITEEADVFLNDIIIRSRHIKQIDIIENKSFKDDNTQKYYRIACFVDYK